ncbi:MAG: DUF3307 domain-containing protein [Candidatus Uhrbacteria bacterium]|nr:DUF3307 domain-containing protein [Candidatus Uhrbacteria bacterium]
MPITELQYWFALFACHNIGDFAFQSQWMALEKGKSREVLAYHVITQASPFMLLSFVTGTHVTLAGIVLHMALHTLVDTLKCRGKIKTIWQDQLCHYVCTAAEHVLGLI